MPIPYIQPTDSGVTAVVSSHIGTAEIIQKGNQVWIDILAKTGEVPLLPARQAMERGAAYPPDHP